MARGYECMTMAVDRLLPSQDAENLIALTRDIADKVLNPIVDAHEKAETYPEGVFARLGAAGLLSLPQPEEWGGGGQPYEIYLQVLEKIAARWAAVASARATYLDAARRRDLGRPYSEQASVAKLVATDAAMKVTTDAVQVFGGVGLTQ